MIRNLPSALARRGRALRPAPAPPSRLAASSASSGRGGGDGDDDRDRADGVGGGGGGRSTEWIPPPRPLGGDAGRSRPFAATARRKGRGEGGGEEEDDFQQGLRELLDRDRAAGETSEFVELDGSLGAEGAEGERDREKMAEKDKSGVIDLESIDTGAGGEEIDWQKIAEKEKWIELEDDDDMEAFRGQKKYGSIIRVEDHVKEYLASDEFDPAELEEDSDDEEDLEEQLRELNQMEEEMLREEEEERQKNGGGAPAADAAPAEEESRSSAASVDEGDLDDAEAASLNMDAFLERTAAASAGGSDGGAASRSAGRGGGPDWLATRRSRLGGGGAAAARAVDMMTPEDAGAARDLDSEIPPIEHTLLSAAELVRCVSAVGGRDARVVLPAPLPDGSSPFGASQEGIVVVTAESTSHVRVIAEAVVRNLKARRLGEVGVVGALLGAEGGEDATTSRYRRSRAGLPGNRVEDGWMAVDCRNYVVHIQDEEMRTAVGLEGLWAGEEGRKLRSVNSGDEEAVDEYVAANPVPEEYARRIMLEGRLGENVAAALGRNRGRGMRWTSEHDRRKKRVKRKGMKRR